MYIYIYYIYTTNIVQMKMKYFQKDEHRFTDHFASLEMSVCVDYEG